MTTQAESQTEATIKEMGQNGFIEILDLDFADMFNYLFSQEAQ